MQELLDSASKQIGAGKVRRKKADAPARPPPRDKSKGFGG